ncbi:MAG: asparagine synthase (glutamine-hydrolyzing) [Elusimicrobiales bacterium]|nr:asparagine synthase (glutamine-hydrolyzing) [Elusimicrobiales bacterium]
MCGICGIIEKEGNKINRDTIISMNLKLTHRGPDDEGYFVKNNIAVGMRRLSIIDIKMGHQPIFNEDETILVVFNGEIYNFRELREELEKKGHIFKTSSDTEVIIHTYEETKIDFPKKLRGMFAIALVDLKEKKIILTRDRLGKKPIYYYKGKDFFAFSSELNSLLEDKRIKREINLEAINMYLTLQYIPSPYTIYKNIFKLEPAQIMVFDIISHSFQIYKYWQIDHNYSLNIDFEEAKYKLRNLVFESVKLRMIADVEIGAFLSGGIDSSIVVGVMSQVSSKAIRTFSIGFEEEKFSELKYAKKVAEKFSTQHTELIIKDKMIDVVEEIPLIYGEPFADPSALPTFYVSKITSKYLKVALNGDGGDEAFAGYSRYVFVNILDKLSKKITKNKLLQILLKLVSKIPEGNAPYNLIWKLRKVSKALLLENIEDAYISSISFFDINEKTNYLTEKFLSYFNSDPAHNYLKKFLKETNVDIIKKITYLDYNSYLPECLMTKMDRASMANSLETRSPLLDHKLVEFAFSLPTNYKIKGSKTKYIFKETFSDLLPKEIKNRGKMGFGIPLGPWFRKELKKIFEENCIKGGFIDRGYFKKEELLKLWNEHINFKKDHGYKLWAILILELWHKKYMNDFKI